MITALVKEFIPQKLHRFIIFKKRPRLIIWLVVTFLVLWSSFGVNWFGFIFSLILFFIIINIALSDTVEKILRKIEDMRRVATKTEKERLLDLYDRVYTQAKAKDKYMSNKIKLYIVDDISINAFALGRNSIAITRGAMEQLNDNEIEALLAHEFGHMRHGDPQLNILLKIGTTFYIWVLLLFKGVIKYINRATSDGSLGDMITNLLEVIIDLTIQVILIIWTVIVSKDNRNKEYRADNFACDLGYREDLLSALYKLYRMQINDKRSLLTRIQSDHPRLAYRIENLENTAS